MKTLTEIENRRDLVLQQIRSLRSMKRGTINEQYLKVPQKGSEPALRGPYHILSRREGNKTVSERLTTQAQLEQAKRDVAAHRKFVELCRDFELLTEKMGLLERQVKGPDKKKWQRRQSRQTGK